MQQLSMYFHWLAYLQYLQFHLVHIGHLDQNMVCFLQIFF